MPVMKVALAGPAGLIGPPIRPEVQEHGQQVSGLVRDDAHAKRVEPRSATTIVIDLYDLTAVVGRITSVVRAIRTASPDGATRHDLENATDPRSRT
jgi:putative NADH-flavin reductase